MVSFSTITSVVTWLGFKGFVGVVAGSVLTVAVPAVYKFVAKQFGWAKNEANTVVSAAKTEVASVASTAAANAVSTVVSDIKAKL